MVPMNPITIPVPTIVEWAQYGITPGVMMFMMVAGWLFTVAIVCRMFILFVKWHTSEMGKVGAAHAVERDNFYNKLDALRDSHDREISRLYDLIGELSDRVARALDNA